MAWGGVCVCERERGGVGGLEGGEMSGENGQLVATLLPEQKSQALSGFCITLYNSEAISE